MTITKIDNSKPGAPTDLTEEAASKPVAPSNLTEQAESKPVAPVNLTEKAKNDPAAPVTLTKLAVSEPLAPLNLSELSKLDPAAPANLTEIAKSEPLAPTNLSELALSNPVAPVNLTEIARPGINRTLSPLFNFNAALGLPESVTYSRSSSASYIETYRGPLGRFQKRLTNDYVGSVENIIFYSEDLLNPRWGLIGGTVIKDNNENMFKLIANDDATAAYILNPNLLAGVTYTSSVEVKAGTKGVSIRITATGSSGSLYFNPENGTIISNGVPEVSIVYLSNGVYRISITNTQNTNGGLYVQVARGVGVSEVKAGDFFFVSKGQVTESAKPLPYVRTFDSAVTETFTAKPRYEEKGLLVEGASTNLLRQSEGADLVTWTKSNLVATANGDLAVDGSQSAEKIRVSNGVILGGGSLIQAVTKNTSPITYTASCYAKPDSVDSIILYCHGTATTNRATVQVNVANGSVGVVQSIGDFTGLTARAEYISNGYYRVSLSFISNSDNVVNIRFYPTDTNVITSDGSLGIIIWGMQLEALPFASSYIRTEGSTVSRSVDVCFASLNVQINQGALLCEGSLKGSQSGSAYYLCGVGSISGEGMGFRDNSSGYWSAVAQVGGSTIVNYGMEDLGGITDNIAVLSFGNFGYDIYGNGEYFTTDPSIGVPIITTVNIGTWISQTLHSYGHVKRLELYDLALTANEVKAL